MCICKPIGWQLCLILVIGGVYKKPDNKWEYLLFDTSRSGGEEMLNKETLNLLLPQVVHIVTPSIPVTRFFTMSKYLETWRVWVWGFFDWREYPSVIPFTVACELDPEAKSSSIGAELWSCQTSFSVGSKIHPLAVDSVKTYSLSNLNREVILQDFVTCYTVKCHCFSIYLSLMHNLCTSLQFISSSRIKSLIVHQAFTNRLGWRAWYLKSTSYMKKCQRFVTWLDDSFVCKVGITEGQLYLHKPHCRTDRVAVSHWLTVVCSTSELHPLQLNHNYHFHQCTFCLFKHEKNMWACGSGHLKVAKSDNCLDQRFSWILSVSDSKLSFVGDSRVIWSVHLGLMIETFRVWQKCIVLHIFGWRQSCCHGNLSRLSSQQPLEHVGDILMQLCQFLLQSCVKLGQKIRTPNWLQFKKIYITLIYACTDWISVLCQSHWLQFTRKKCCHTLWYCKVCQISLHLCSKHLWKKKVIKNFNQDTRNVTPQSVLGGFFEALFFGRHQHQVLFGF